MTLRQTADRDTDLIASRHTRRETITACRHQLGINFIADEAYLPLHAQSDNRRHDFARADSARRVVGKIDYDSPSTERTCRHELVWIGLKPTVSGRRDTHHSGAGCGIGRIVRFAQDGFVTLFGKYKAVANKAF